MNSNGNAGHAGHAGHIAVSAVVLMAFSAATAALLTHTVPAENGTLANVLLGTLSAMAVAVVNFWLGSSASSARKDVQLSAAQDALATSVPTSALGSVQKPEDNNVH
jgi:high-affinity Fe2+/Pb2+ permease